VREDRHGRAARADHDPRRRPSDGFRVRDVARFERIAEEAVGTLPREVLAALDEAELVVEEVPPEPAPGEDVALAGFAPAEDGAPARVTLYRRPLELRATSRLELGELVRLAVGHEVIATLDLDVNLDDDWDEP
jgi:predicted Zn-dependent protease with MMP-like domain